MEGIDNKGRKKEKKTKTRISQTGSLLLYYDFPLWLPWQSVLLLTQGRPGLSSVVYNLTSSQWGNPV